MKKHYYFVSGKITCNRVPDYAEVIDVSGSFELVQGEERENQFPLEVPDEKFFLEVPAKLEELLKEKFLQENKGARIKNVQLYSISRLN